MEVNYEVCAYLGQRVIESMKSLDLTNVQLAHTIYPFLNYTEKTARDFISRVRQGEIPAIYKNREQDESIKRKQLQRVSLLISALQISSEDDLIKRLKEEFEEFVFPLASRIESLEELAKRIRLSA